MADFLEDVLTAFNYSRYKVADDFRFMKDDNMKAYRSGAQAWVNSVAKDYGDESWALYGTAFVASLGEVLFDFVQGVGEATFIDPLRLGEGSRKGGFGYIEDGLRVVGVFGGVLKLFKFARMARVVGSPLSCTPTSVTKGLRLASLSFATIEEVAAGTSGGASPATIAYQGAWIEDVLPTIRNFVKVEQRAVMGFYDIEAIVAEQKGPVAFSVEWAGSAGIPGGGHSMVAYRTAGGTFALADQFGNSHTWRAGGGVIEILAGPGSKHPITGVALQAGTSIGRVNRIYSKGGGSIVYLLKETVLMQAVPNAPLLQRIGVPLLTPHDRQFNLKLGFAASMLPSAPPGLAAAGAAIPTLPVLKVGIENVYGWWWVAAGGGRWTYYFGRNGAVRWYDLFNHRSGSGTFVDIEGGVEVAWASGTRETWVGEMTPSNQDVTSVTKSGAATKMKAVKVWDARLAQITGRWRMHCDKWIWWIDINENGTIKWTDFYSEKENGSGTGTFHLTGKGIYVMWKSGSRDEWAIPEDGGKATGKATVSGKFYNFEAIRP